MTLCAREGRVYVAVGRGLVGDKRGCLREGVVVEETLFSLFRDMESMFALEEGMLALQDEFVCFPDTVAFF